MLDSLPNFPYTIPRKADGIPLAGRRLISEYKSRRKGWKAGGPRKTREVSQTEGWRAGGRR